VSERRAASSVATATTNVLTVRKRQLQMFYLRESVAAATNVLSARKHSGSGKALSRNGNQPLDLLKSHTFI